MFKHKVVGKNIDVTEAINQYVIDKLSVLEKYIDTQHEVTTTVRVYPDKSAKVETHIFGVNIHAEDTSKDLYASIDNVVEKLDGQFRKVKTQRINRQQGK